MPLLSLRTKLTNLIKDKKLMKQNQLTILNNLPETVKNLNSSLQAIQPDNSETTRLVTYVLVGTVVAGLLVYQYIKSQEKIF